MKNCIVLITEDSEIENVAAEEVMLNGVIPGRMDDQGNVLCKMMDFVAATVIATKKALDEQFMEAIADDLEAHTLIVPPSPVLYGPDGSPIRR